MDISVIIDSINVFLLLIRLIHDTDCFHLFSAAKVIKKLIQ